MSAKKDQGKQGKQPELPEGANVPEHVSDLWSILQDIAKIESEFSGLLSEFEKAELSRIRAELRVRALVAPTLPTLQEVFAPRNLEYLDRQAVRLTWDFTSREMGAWQGGDWILFSGGLRVPAARTTDADFWDPDHALRLSLGTCSGTQ